MLVKNSVDINISNYFWMSLFTPQFSAIISAWIMQSGNQGEGGEEEEQLTMAAASIRSKQSQVWQ